MYKKIIYMSITALSLTAVLASCETKTKKVENAQTEVAEAQEELKEAKLELNAEYPAFKVDAENRIMANENRIAELQAILNKPGKLPLDPLRKKQIDDLQERNAKIKSRLYNYETERTDWIIFKKEFNHDMDAIADGFKSLSKDNVK